MNTRIVLTVVAFACACSRPEPVQPEQSSLPQRLPDDGDSAYCDDVPESEWRGYEPSLAAWVAVADSIFVGTIADVRSIDSPAYFVDADVLSPDDATVTEIASLADCPDGGVQYPKYRFEFEDVVTIHGDEVPAEFSIEMGRMDADGYPGVYLNASGIPIDATGQRVYFPGSRVGSALYKDADGNHHWKHRQFEVLSGKVHLQQIDRTITGCSRLPHITGIPDEYEGASFDDFADAIRSAPRPLTAEEEAATAERNTAYRAMLDSAQFKARTQPHCFPPDQPLDPNDPGDRDE